ncbi:hypothetical protein Moror_15675 [Moniliophthora roreri MCA 2997]|uniref:Uncharacterized protein n=1 Tax=Moniliophthora roreri (strain MCA 2997) TaxID=1381753 RepID=V2XPW1_MONRO|nr:hypothetical protein Moror_15675 [Moniliophthora roreri MCA 2997]
MADSVALLFATNLATIGGHVAEMISIFVYPVIGYFWTRRRRRSPSVDFNVTEELPRSMALVEGMTDPIESLAKCIASLVLVLQALESLRADEALSQLPKGRNRFSKLFQEHNGLQEGILTLTEELSQRHVTTPEDPAILQMIAHVSQKVRLLKLKTEMLSIDIRKVKSVCGDIGNTVEFIDVDPEQGLPYQPPAVHEQAPRVIQEKDTPQCPYYRSSSIEKSELRFTSQPIVSPLNEETTKENINGYCETQSSDLSILPIGPLGHDWDEHSKLEQRQHLKLPKRGTGIIIAVYNWLGNQFIQEILEPIMTQNPIHGSAHSLANLSDSAQSLLDYLDPESQNVSLPIFDIDHLSDAMKQITIHIQRVQTHVDVFEGAALTARTRVSHLQSLLKSYQNLSIPIVRMPSELLALVFEYCVQADTGGHALSHHATAWVLGQTCQRWRTVALSTPSLWRIIRVNTRILNRCDCHTNHLTMLRTWLERSRQIPISCLAILDDQEKSEINANILDLLITHSNRWYAVDFTFGRQGSLYERFSAMEGSLPVLRACRLKVTINAESERLGGRRWSVWDAPNLKEATFYVVSDRDHILHEIIPQWTQLEELAWMLNTPIPFLDVASSFTNLRYCYIDISTDVDIPTTQRCVLPCLRHLDVAGPFYSVLGIINRLSLPSLQDLDLDFDEHIGGVADHLLLSLGRLQARSSCHLRHLSAPFPMFSSPNASLLVEKIGTVDDLRVLLSTEEDNKPAIDNFIGGRVFRGLRTLHLLFREPPDEDPTLFSRAVDMVQSRRTLHPGVSRLEKLSLDFVRSPFSADERISTRLQPFQKLKELQRDGLILLGRAVDNKWHSIYGDAHWNAGDFRRAARRWARFGYSDWLYEQEIADYLKHEVTY